MASLHIAPPKTTASTAVHDIVKIRPCNKAVPCVYQQTLRAPLRGEADRAGRLGAGDNFSYTEAMEVPGPVVAGLGSTVLALIYIVLSLRFLRPLVMKLLPAPGEGPSEKQQVEGFWCVHCVCAQNSINGSSYV